MPIDASPAGTLDIENATLRSREIVALTNMVAGNDVVRSGGPALEVYGDPSHGGNEARLELVSNTATVSSSAFTRLTSNAGVFSIKSGTDASDNGTITFGGFANERMRIGSDGNVGIGTTDPQYKLDVGNGGGDVMLRVMHQTASSGKLIFGRSGNTEIRSHAIESYNSSGSQNNYMKFLVHDGTGISPYETRTEVMTLLGNGKVGVGTTSPAAQLEIHGFGQTSETTFDQTGSMGGVLALRSDDGSVGSGGAVMFGSHAGFHAAIKASLEDGSTNTRGRLAFFTRSNTTDATMSHAMTIADGGNVGIGTTNPGSKLVVSDGDVSVTNGIQNMTKNATYSRLMRLGVTSGGTGMGFHMGTGGGGGSWTATSIPMIVNNSGGGTILFLFNINRSSADATSSHFYMIRKRYDGGSNWTQTSSTVVQLAYLTGAGGNGTLYFRQNNNYLEYKFDQVGNGHFYAIECD